jgi:hypothetical protein
MGFLDFVQNASIAGREAESRMLFTLEYHTKMDVL